MSAELVGSLAGILAAMAWAANGLLIRAHGVGLHAVAINALRCTIASVFFVAIWPYVSSGAPVPAQTWVFLILSTLLGLGLGDSLYFEAIKCIGVARAMPISMAYPVLAALGAVVLLHEPLGPLAFLGVLLTLGGVYLVAAPPRSSQPVEGYWRGVLLASVAAVGWTCSTLLLRPLLQLVDVPTASAIRMPMASLLLWATAARVGVLPHAKQLRGRALVAVAATGAVTVLATVFFLESVALAGAGRAAVLTATAPLFGVPLAVLFLGERASGRLGIGTVCSVVGVACLASS